ncbi:MAG: Hpt domain-containing protein [Candidatus Thiodiazotropha sp. (ex Ctena orbiculata)]|uniref:Chemotaxis protein CheA n=1 Tax=Candidatus Thiodiazotropha taylori TaxID=2792791 RepID=A0A944MA74_9GAMM|nr:Hpt domain-containing protein [Candidatus Thiodiazotropha taylori]
MSNAQDFGALNWVKDELDVSIRHARQALEAHVESPGDGSSLAVCGDHLHQIARVLQMVQVYGPSMLAEEMELVVRDMAEGIVRQEEDAAEALMLALIQLPDYLEKLQGGDADIPMIILPLLNDLRAVRDAPLLSEAALFKPEIDTVRADGDANDELPNLVRQIRQKYHLGLLSWYRKRDTVHGWPLLRDVFATLHQHSGTESAHHLFWVAEGLMQGLIEGTIAPGIAVKQLFSRLDRKMKMIIDGGELALVEKPPEALLKNLLYYIARAQSDNAQIKEIKEAYSLDSVMPSEAELTEGRLGLTGSNAELAESIKDAVGNELTRIKDILDLFMRDDKPDMEMLGHLEAPIRKLADTLGMIGQGALRSRLNRQADKVKNFVEQGVLPEEFELMEMAGDILYVESSLSTLHTFQPQSEEGPSEDELVQSLPEGEYQNLIKQTVREAKVEIAKAKEAIISFTEATDDSSVLHNVYECFKRVEGALNMLNLREAAELMSQTGEFIQSYLIDSGQIPERQQLNSLADVVSSIEYYLETLVDGAGDRQEIMAIAQASLSNLVSQGGVEVGQYTEPAESIEIEESADHVEGYELEEEDVSDLEMGASSLQIEQPQPEVDILPREAADMPPGDEAEIQESEGEPEAKAEPLPETEIASADKPMLEDIDPEILEIFTEEAREELATIQQYLPQWQRDQNDSDALTTFRRSFHTLKGSGRLVGAKVIGELAWSVENMLNRLIDETIKVTPDMMDLLNRVVDALPELISCQERGVYPALDVDFIQRQAYALADGKPMPMAEEGREAVDEAAEEVRVEAVDEAAEEVRVEAVDEAAEEVRMEAADEAAEEEPLLEIDTEPSQFAEDESSEGAAEVDEIEAEEGIEAAAVDNQFEGDLEMHLDELLGLEVDTEVSDLSVEDSEVSADTLAAEIDSAADIEDALPGQASEEDILDDYTDSDLEIEIDSELLEVFGEESEEHLLEIEQFITGAKDAKTEVLIPEDVVRACHTLHGSAHMAGITPIAMLSEAMEDYARAMHEQQQVADENSLDLLGGSVAYIRKLLSWLPEESLPEPHVDTYILGLRSALEEIASESLELEPLSEAEPIFPSEEAVSEAAIEAEAEASDERADVAAGDEPDEEAEAEQPDEGSELSAVDALSVEAFDEQAGEAEAEQSDESIEIPDVEELSADAIEELQLEEQAETAAEDIVVPFQLDRDSQAIEAEEEAEQPLELPALEAGESNLLDLASYQLDEQQFEVEGDEELVGIFVEEGRELLDNLEQHYQKWIDSPLDSSLIDEFKRSLHTLKGSSRLAGINPIGDLSHGLENLFERMSRDELKPESSIRSMVRQAIDVLATQIDDADSGSDIHFSTSLLAALESPVIGAETEATALGGTDEESLAEELKEVEEAISEAEHVEPVDTSSYYDEPMSFLHEGDLFEVSEDPELVQIFIEESRELLETLEENYKQWSDTPSDHTTLDGMQRALHTIKGSSRLAGIEPVGDLSHAMESLLNGVLRGHIESSDKVFAISRQAIDLIATQTDDAATSGKVHRGDQLIEQIQLIVDGASLEEDSIEELIDQELQEELETAEEAVDEAGQTEESAADGEDLEIPFESFNLDGINDRAISDTDESFMLMHDEVLLDVGEDEELVQIFIEEAKEFIEHIESSYQQWLDDLDDHTAIEGVQRNLHTLKGSARLAGIMPVGDLSHSVESVMTALAEKEIDPIDTVTDSVRHAIDHLALQIETIAKSGKVPASDTEVEQLQNLLGGEPTPSYTGMVETIQAVPESDGSDETLEEAEEVVETATVLPFNDEIAKLLEPEAKEEDKESFKPTKEQVRVNADLMDRLVNHAGEVSIYRARLEQQNSVLGFNLSELEQTVSRLHTQLRNLEIETEAQIIYRWEREHEDDREKAEFDPLEMDRFSTMQQLSRALMETVNDLGNINEALRDLQRETDTLLLQQSRISTDLQDGLLRTRMVPFAQLVPRMQRLVRQTAGQLSKRANLECFGVEGELDRSILNRMVPVLEHLLRNSVSHGIEYPENRQQAGKQEVGRISLYLDREATDVLITLSDDGRGLDIEAIRKRALEQGMIDANAEISDDDLIQCVLLPGFSTAEEVTQISGRGVGLDVVTSEVKQLGGSLEIDSQPGRGTSFIIRLPLTLAISDALLVRVGEEVYAVPHGSISGVVRIRRQELMTCYEGGQDGFTYGGRRYKVSYLGRMMGMGQHEIPETTRWLPLLLLQTGDHQAALQVDELLGSRQVVVKSMGKQVGSVRWITGGTILADGRVALILDLASLVRMDATHAAAPLSLVRETPEKRAEDRLRVMVVDDSITVRKVTSRLLERHDMDVVTAKDGVEAVALLQEQVPDIMLLDIEMPRMDGFELARHINNSVDYYGLPIIMISSRVGEKHRQRAMDLGVKRCLGKPYQETELLDNINEVLAESRL